MSNSEGDLCEDCELTCQPEPVEGDYQEPGFDKLNLTGTSTNEIQITIHLI